MTKHGATAIVLSTFLLSTSPTAEQPLPDSGTGQQPDSGFSGIAGESALPVPQEAFVDTTYPCREARTLYNLLMAEASDRGPDAWLGVLVSSPYRVAAGWYANVGRGLYLELSIGDVHLVSFVDGHTLDGEVDNVRIGEALPIPPRNLGDTIFYRWALDNVLQIVRGEANPEDDKALLFYAREWYENQR